MWEDSSDLTQSSKSTVQIDDSEIEKQLIAETKQAQLQEQNEQLLKENTSLQAQYKQAIQFTTQIEEMHQKNRQLSTDLRQSRAENENLNKRLEISQKLNEDLKQKMEAEKQSAAELRRSDLAASQKEIQKVKLQLNAQMDDVYEQMEKLKQSKEQDELTIKMMNSKVERILDAASHYYELQFATADDLISFLNQIPPVSTQPVSVKPQTSVPVLATINNPDLATFEKKFKHAHAKVKSLKQQNEELENKVVALEREIQKIKTQSQQEIAQLTNQAKQQQEEQALADARQKHTIGNLQAKIEALNTKLINERKKKEAINTQNNDKTTSLEIPQLVQMALPPQQQFQVETSHHCNEDISNCPASEHLVNQNIDLTCKLQTSQRKCDDLANQLHSVEQHYTDLELAYNKQKNDYNSLTIVHKDTVAELEMMRNALHEKNSHQDRGTLKVLKKELQAQKAQSQNLLNQVESQKQQLDELSIDKQQGLHTIDTQQITIHDLKQDLQASNEKVQKLKDELFAAQIEISKKENASNEHIIPPNGYISSVFASELNTSISQIARNISLQPISKIQNIYKIIASYFNDIIVARDKSLESSYAENQKLSNLFNQLLLNLSIALEMEPITLNDFMTNQSEQKIISSITTIRSCHNDLKRKNEQLMQTIEFINKTFNLKTANDGVHELGEIEHQINCVKNQLNTVTEKLTKQTKKCKELASNLKALKKKADIEQTNAKATIERMHATIATLEKDNSELSQSNQKLKWDNQNINAKYQDFKQQHEDKIEELNEKYESYEKSSKQEIANLKSEFLDRMNAAQEQIKRLNNTINQNLNQIDCQKNSIEKLKLTIYEKDQLIEQNHQKYEEILKETNNKYEYQKRQLIESYENSMAELRQQCDAHRLDLEKISKVLATTEKKLKQAKETNLQLRKEKMKCEADLKSLQEQNERQIKLNETTSKVALLSVQSEYHSKLDQEKAKMEEEKRRIYETVADSFKQFTSPHENLTEKSLKTTIMKARDEITRLTSLDSAIRRMVNADRTQKTDDAVAQMVMRVE